MSLYSENEIMEKWDYIRELIENKRGGSLPRDIFESIIDYYQERIDVLEQSLKEIKRECETHTVVIGDKKGFYLIYDISKNALGE